MKMNAQERFDDELEGRELSLVPINEVEEIRNVCRYPRTGAEALHARLLNGCRVLDLDGGDRNWQLFEVILMAWHCCQLEIEAERNRIETEYTELIRTNQDIRETRRRLHKTNTKSLRAYDAYEDTRNALMAQESSKPGLLGTARN